MKPLVSVCIPAYNNADDMIEKMLSKKRQRRCRKRLRN